MYTQEEQEILEAFESGDIQPIQNANEEIEKHKKYAANTFKLVLCQPNFVTYLMIG